MYFLLSLLNDVMFWWHRIACSYSKNPPKLAKKIHEKCHSAFLCGVWALTWVRTLHVRWITCLLKANWRARVKKMMHILHIEAHIRADLFNYLKWQLSHIFVLLLHSCPASVLGATLRKSTTLDVFVLSCFCYSLSWTSYCTNYIISRCIIGNPYWLGQYLLLSQWQYKKILEYNS